MKELPEGKSLGWMQAPASWISSHTVRFIGVVRVVIQDGEGFILIKKGKPLFHYFKHGTIELKGHTALDYFNSHPVIEFNLCKYTPDEFAWALKICNIEDHDAVVPKEPAVSGPVAREHNPPSRPADLPVAKPAGNKRIPDPVVVSPQVHTVDKRAAVSGPVTMEYNPPSRPADLPVAKPAGNKRIADPVVVSPQVHTVEERPVVPQPVVCDDPDVTIISQIRDLNGIVAISVFNDKRTVIMMGDADSEVLLKIARKMLETAKKMTPRLTWGPFVHMTIQIPAGNMIIAPYHDNYLCLLTTRTINIGHIRRILRDLQQKGAPQRVS
jgi:predicted regulator of Ras-like GTPase activity (Roadblock/LC7/MglB family)